jgi:predicted  nucleic acid-binding Zn-ribbon protein
MSDVLKRLRARTAHPYMGGEGASLQRDLHGAIEEIERLAAEVERLQERCEGYKGQVKAGAEEIEQLRKYKRMAMEDIMTLGQMVGRNCPMCQRGEK